MATMVQAEIWTIARTEMGNAVLLRPIASNIAVPIVVGQLELQSILTGFGDVKTPRPLSHDLMLEAFRVLHADLKRIEIHDLKDSIYYAHILVEQQGRELSLDARPSDAIGLAVRKKCSVYIAEFIVETAGIPVSNLVDSAGNSLEPNESTWPRSEVEALEVKLAVCLSHEEYEQAAELRDQIMALRKQSEQSTEK